MLLVYNRGSHKVRRLVWWIEFYLIFAYNLYKEFETIHVVKLWKMKPNRMKINVLFIKYKLHDMVIRCILRWVAWRLTASLFFYVTHYALPHFSTRYTRGVKYRLKHSHISMIIKRFKLTRVNIWVNHFHIFSRAMFLVNVSQYMINDTANGH